MEQSAIFAPVMAMMLLTLLVWCYMYSKRIPFIRGSNFGPGELTPLELARRSPPAVSNPSDNLKNLFELPVIFYALCLILFVTGRVDRFFVAAAWVFVVLRVLHSAVHCTVNVILLRFAIYAVASLALWVMVVRTALQMLTAA